LRGAVEHPSAHIGSCWAEDKGAGF